MKKTVKKYLLFYLSTIVLFCSGLILVYLIPNHSLEPQYTKSIAQIKAEDSYANFLFNSDASILDNFMDRLMLETCKVSDSYHNVFQAAFDNNGYPRYWNGYLLTLRPALTQFTYQQIRYLNMFVLLLLFCFVFSGIQKNFSAIMAAGFAVSITACFIIFIGESLQYFSVFLILFLVMAAFLYIPKLRRPDVAGVVLFITGMVTNFFDMLTAPLLTLGFPLLLIISFIIQEHKEEKSRYFFLHILRLSIAWSAGYALCWVSKWAIGSLVLGENVFSDAMTTAKFRIGGNEGYPLSRALMYKLNFETYFFAKGHKPFLFIAGIIILLAIIMFKFHKQNWKPVFLCALLIGLFPYFWFFVFANHSQLHYFYTYRIQAITLFSLFAAISNSIDFNKLLKYVGKEKP